MVNSSQRRIEQSSAWPSIKGVHCFPSLTTEEGAAAIHARLKQMPGYKGASNPFRVRNLRPSLCLILSARHSHGLRAVHDLLVCVGKAKEEELCGPSYVRMLRVRLEPPHQKQRVRHMRCGGVVESVSGLHECL